MQKIPTIFLRDENFKITEEINPVADWVFRGEGQATIKYDGTCVMKDDAGRWWARREIKKGGRAKANFVLVHFDEVTGKSQGWEPIEDSPHHKIFRSKGFGTALKAGTFELVGPKINGNPHGFDTNVLIRHATSPEVYANDLTFAGIRRLVLQLSEQTAEGIVWHHPDGRMAKIKARDFR